MRTPVCDFVREYAARRTVRMHMPGHKGKKLTGPEAADITEITGADELYHARGILRESEENAAKLFGTGRTVYSAEGSSLCIRAMLYLARLTAAESGRPARLLAARNAHKTLMTAAALLDLEIDWLYPRPEEGLLSCRVRPEEVEEHLKRQDYMAVYLTSPDYLGQRQDIRGIAEVCRRHGVPLLTDNAHGAYLKFLGEDVHPITLGADACCDSAHKTLSCLTGAAYLHLSVHAPAAWPEQAEEAMAMFASTSPSWLILQSLDRMNRELAGEWPEKLRTAAHRTEDLKQELREAGWVLAGSEPMKLTLDAGNAGYTGDTLHEILRGRGIEAEFADRRHVVLMPSAETARSEWERLREALTAIPIRESIPTREVPFEAPEKVRRIREAMLSPRERVPVAQAAGRVLADAYCGCPPAVPPVIAGERISASTAERMATYGITSCLVIKND